MEQLGRQSKKVLIGIIGGIVVLAGLVMIPYPGPGWLVVFAGLAILATEFVFASKVLTFARSKYDAWVAWLSRQHALLRLLVLSCTALVIIVTVWLVNGFGVLNAVLGLQLDWLTSPFFR